MLYFLCLLFCLTMRGCSLSQQQTVNTTPSSLPRQLCAGDYCFNLRYAITPQERERGLMHVTTLPMNEGMLFDFGQPQITFFWMKNTLIPLDILRLDDEWTIKGTRLNALPCPSTVRECPSEGPGIPTRYVLEINAGLTEKIGLTSGSRFIPKY